MPSSAAQPTVITSLTKLTLDRRDVSEDSPQVFRGLLFAAALSLGSLSVVGSATYAWIRLA